METHMDNVHGAGGSNAEASEEVEAEQLEDKEIDLMALEGDGEEGDELHEGEDEECLDEEDEDGMDDRDDEEVLQVRI